MRLPLLTGTSGAGLAFFRPWKGAAHVCAIAKCHVSLSRAAAGGQTSAARGCGAWRRCHVGFEGGVFSPEKRLLSTMGVDCGKVEEQQQLQDVCLSECLDLFAKSRMLNYLSRYNSDADEACGRRPSPFLTTQTSDKALFQVELLVPVEVPVSGVIQRTSFRAVGFAVNEKDAVIAACMHAERCLDSLGIPLFTSERLQRKRVLEAESEGRYAPLPGDPVRELRVGDLPFPLLYKKSDNESGTTGRGGRKCDKGAYPQLRSYQPNYHTAKRRFNDFTRRCGADPFLRGVAGELAYLQAAIFKHNTSVSEGQEDEDDGGPLTIDPAEVELLQPTHTPLNTAVSTDATAYLQGAPATRLAIVTSRPLSDHRVAGFIDESEAGRYDLVEGEQGTWFLYDNLPGLSCLFDPAAQKRLDGLYRTHYGASFGSCVSTVAREELTQVDVGFGPSCTKEVKWFTATAPIPGYDTLQATGKALSVGHAVHLCAMHAELLLSFMGIPISNDSIEQARHYDACLCHGRLVSPMPRELDDEVRQHLPKPLKQWQRVKKSRKRGAPMNLAEKLLALNRRVVADIRQHLVEVDICNEPQYRELLDLSVATLRQFMVEQRHPYESAYVNFIYAENNQFRCSIYLPLPEVYGIRGGCAIGATPEGARELCALHAIDTLCALNVPISQNRQKLERLMDLRKQFGLTVLRDRNGDAANSGLLCNIRSPPGYREAPGRATKRVTPHRDVWNLVMTDAGDFDVMMDVDAQKCYKLGFPDPGTLLRSLFQTYLQTVGWSVDDQWSHMRHYQGLQHWKGRLRLPCNNFWMELPVNEGVYGRRVALGRCVFRKGAEKAFYVHALRILHTLRLAPWDMYTDETLHQLLRNKDGVNIDRERLWWNFVVDELIQPAEGTADGSDGTPRPTVREAEVVVRPGADFKTIPSPNPVMTHELAKKTFI